MKIFFLIGLLSAMLMAQDTRKVVEPVIPAACTLTGEVHRPGFARSGKAKSEALSH